MLGMEEGRAGQFKIQAARPGSPRNDRDDERNTGCAKPLGSIAHQRSDLPKHRQISSPKHGLDTDLLSLLSWRFTATSTIRRTTATGCRRATLLDLRDGLRPLRATDDRQGSGSRMAEEHCRMFCAACHNPIC